MISSVSTVTVCATVILYLEGDGASLPETFITTLSDAMYVGTTGGMARYDSRYDRFYRFIFPFADKPRITRIIPWRGGIVVGTEGYGLFYAKNGSLEMNELKVAGDDMRFFSALHTDRHGVMTYKDGELRTVITALSYAICD